MERANGELRFPNLSKAKTTSQLQLLLNISSTATTPQQTAMLDEIFKAGYWTSQLIHEGSKLQEELQTTQRELSSVKDMLNSTKAELTKSQIQLVDSSSAYDSLVQDHEIEKRVIRETLQIRSPALVNYLRTPEHPDPDHFSGTVPKELPMFLNKMQLKLRANRDWWTTEQDRLDYFLSRLSGGAYGQISSGTDGVTNCSTIDEAVVILKSCYGRLNEKATAQKDLLKLHQGNRPLSEFLPIWLQTAQCADLGDETHIVALENALHPAILNRAALYATDSVPVKWREYVNWIRRTEADLRSFDPNYFKPNSSSPRTVIQIPITTPSQSSEPMDLSALQMKTVWTGSQGGKRRPRNDAEKAAKREYCLINNLCLYCESPEHRLSECKSLAERRSSTKN